MLRTKREDSAAQARQHAALTCSTPPPLLRVAVGPPPLSRRLPAVARRSARPSGRRPCSTSLPRPRRRGRGNCCGGGGSLAAAGGGRNGAGGAGRPGGDSATDGGSRHVADSVARDRAALTLTRPATLDNVDITTVADDMIVAHQPAPSSAVVRLTELQPDTTTTSATSRSGPFHGPRASCCVASAPSTTSTSARSSAASSTTIRGARSNVWHPASRPIPTR